MKNRVVSFKLTEKGNNMSSTPGQEGKTITIYANADPSKSASDWQEILENITNSLLKAGIKAGVRAPGTLKKPEKEVSGCPYATYRYDVDDWPKVDHCEKICVKPKPKYAEQNVQEKNQTIVEKSDSEEKSENIDTPTNSKDDSTIVVNNNNENTDTPTNSEDDSSTEDNNRGCFGCFKK